VSPKSSSPIGPNLLSLDPSPLIPSLSLSPYPYLSPHLPRAKGQEGGGGRGTPASGGRRGRRRPRPGARGGGSGGSSGRVGGWTGERPSGGNGSGNTRTGRRRCVPWPSSRRRRALVGRRAATGADHAGRGRARRERAFFYFRKNHCLPSVFFSSTLGKQDMFAECLCR